MDAATSNWRNQLEPQTRKFLLEHIIIKLNSVIFLGITMKTLNIEKLLRALSRKVMLVLQPRTETLIRCSSVSDSEGSQLRRIAQSFEEKIFTIASNQSDYLRKISLKMLTVETRYRHSHGPLSNQLCLYHERANPGIVTQPQVHNPGQEHHMPLHMQPGQQHHLSQNIENNIG
ncbi:hypothetical protein PIB30_000125 [Stylosanthes scabra]|uniref:Mediator complex subunit 15 KIX domain-containing protein n=1 Tax=Stylosanthes scabra TaxID=79078 RepID=A0ABU6R283_9FABA|nr:hypothetical protein [Stylosanthes scabra]